MLAKNDIRLDKACDLDLLIPHIFVFAFTIRGFFLERRDKDIVGSGYENFVPNNHRAKQHTGTEEFTFVLDLKH